MLRAMRGREIAVDREPDTDRIVTIPNVISLGRLIAIPFFVWLMLEERTVAAAVALAVIAGTDWIDGGLARRWHQVTTVGKVLDPTIDRLLILAAFIAALASGAMPVWLAVIILGREVLVSLGGIWFAARGRTRISVTWWGKVYASGVMAMLPLFILGSADFTGAWVATVLAWVLAVPCSVLAWITAYEYWRTARAAARRG